ncbi:MAG TPA: hypothetical protein VJY36_00955 [Candidatus Bathyarchaeia archaeon]|nr:hypothetical protein [Candidatus Bathyarchaeia archaeon]
MTACFFMPDLSRPCDGCGKMIGGGFHNCSKFQIYFCFLCSYELMSVQKKLPIECPMCGGKMEQQICTNGVKLKNASY